MGAMSDAKKQPHASHDDVRSGEAGHEADRARAVAGDREGELSPPEVAEAGEAARLGLT